MSTETKGITSSNIITVDDQNFETNVLNAKLLTIVDFSAEWCPPCRALDPVYARLSTEFTGKVRFTHFDIDENPLIFTRYHVEAAPTLIFFKDGQEIERIVGPYPGRLKVQIERILAEVEQA